MSRRLDALFAEQVLGCKVDRSRMKQYGEEAWDFIRCGCDVSEPPHNELDNCCGTREHTYLAPYTTSLDAAWQGVEKLDSEWNFHLHRDSDGWCAELTAQDWVKKGGAIREGAASPALAIVLACLRAVGVSEEEIKCAGE